MNDPTLARTPTHPSAPDTVSGWEWSKPARRVLLAVHITLACVWLGALLVTLQALLSTVSVVAATATQANAWSTAIMVGGAALARRALALGEVRRVWLVDKQGLAGWVA